jgi:Eukaryotic aspartyl protease
MRSALSILGASLVLLGVDGLTLVKKDTPSIVSFPFERSLGIPASRNRRRGTVETPLNNEQLVYTVNLMLGTPPQQTRVQLDTGSSDLVVETDSSNLCASQPVVCTSRGACEFATCVF